MNDVHVVVPDGIDDPQRPSGGNVYDRRLCRELAALGWPVHEHPVPGSWPIPSPADVAVLGATLDGIPARAVVLLDGLVASAAPEVLVPRAARLTLVVLVHMPLGDDDSPNGDGARTRRREGAVLSAVDAVLVPSEWTRRRLLERHALPSGRVHVAEPGVDPGSVAPGTTDGGELLCVATVAPHKGHDLLLAALATLRHLSWRCTFVGRLDLDPGFLELLRRRARRDGISDRLRFTGPLTRRALDAAYVGSDVLVLPSRAETYGMVVTEALAHGLPVVATAVGGLPQALGRDSEGGTPGVLVPPEEPSALAEALSGWLCDGDLRQRLRHAARERRAGLPGWPATTNRVARVVRDLG